MADRRLWITIGANISGLQAGLATAAQGVRDFDKSLQQSAARRQGLTTLGTTFGKIGLLAAGVAGVSIKSAMDWESAWAGVNKTVDGTVDQMAALEGQLREMARSMPATHQEIAAVAEAAGQLGVRREDIADFTRVMVMLGETTNLTADEAATSLAQFMNVMQTAPQDVDNLGAAVVALGNDGASTERDIVQMAQRIAGAGKTIGASESDVLALSNALASVGIEADAGGTAVSKILIDMAKAAKTNSKTLSTWAATSGMSIAQFKQSMEKAPIETFNALTKGLSKINDEGGDVFTLLSNLGQSDRRVTDALLRMANSGDLLTDSLKLGKESFAENSALADEYGKRAETAAAKAQVAWNGIKDNLIDIGANALPVVKDLSESVAGLTGWFSDLPPLVQGSALKFLALTAAVGGTGFVVSRAVTGFSNLANTLNSISGNGDKITRSQLFARGGSLVLGMGLLSISEAAGEANTHLGAAATASSALLLGWGAGGPAGAAIATAGLFFKGIIEHSTAAEKRQRELIERTKKVIELFDQQTGAVTAAAEAEQRRALAKDGTLDDAKKKGLNLDDVVKASLGDVQAMERINKRLQAAADERQEQVDRLRGDLGVGSTAAFGDIVGGPKPAPLSPADQRFTNELKIQSDQVKSLRREVSLANEAVYESAGAFGEVARGLAIAAGGADKYVGSIEKVPKKVRTDVEQNGAQASEESIKALARAYDMTPKEVLTELAAQDLASGKLKVVKGELVGLDGKRATVHVNANTALARAAINGLFRFADSLPFINVRAGVTPQSRGGVLDFYADGGMRENHVAQIAPAGAWRVWAEPETGGEAYIPLAESKRQRSLEIWAETGRRLGVQGFANGGVSGGSAPAGYMLPPGARFRLVGTDLVELVDSRARGVVDSQRSYDAASRRQKGVGR